MKTFTQISMSLALTLGLGSVALAGDAKAPATPATPATTAKKEAAPAAKKPEPMKAPQEIADMAKSMGGSWKCTGKAAMDPANPAAMTDMKMSLKMTTDLGGWWIKNTMDAGAMFKGEEYITYDPTAKKFISLMRDSMGGSETKTSMGMKDNKMVWEGDARSAMPGMTAAKSRSTVDMTDAKAGVKMTGEYSMDGKTWMKAWEASCKK
jgi:uncharacterized protein DUF1579